MTGRTTVNRIVVVVPARDEEELAGECLASVIDAAQAVPIPVRIVLVADHCTDSTVPVARSLSGVEVLETQFANVGAARAAGVRFALSGLHGTVWIANTDADSTVPRDWLQGQLDAAQAGYELMIGTVRPRFDDLTAEQERHWHNTHDDGQAIGHVHGANLGILAGTYRAAGSFHPQAEHEDASLVSRARAIGARILATETLEVQTSGRLRGKTPGGYAAHLAGEHRALGISA